MGITYRREIDGLRAIAVCAVVLYHAGIGGAGFVGVDVFFVISGYLITALLLREGQIDLMGFYARRVRRIFPAAVLIVLATLAASWLLLPAPVQVGVNQSAASAALFAANFYFQSLTSGYFNADTGQFPLLHLWSLSVEEQFYLLWPALLIWIPRHRLVPALIFLALASFGLTEWLMNGNPQAAFYQMPARYWELAAGGIIAALPARPMYRYAAPAGILLTVAACIWSLGHFPGVGALPAVLGASLVIAAVHGGGTNALLASRPFVGIGLISYSLYLWHWPLLAFDRLLRVGPSPWETRAALVLASLVLAFATYRYIEQPFRKMRWPKGRTVAYGLAGMAIIACSTWRWDELRVQPATVAIVNPNCHPYDPTKPAKMEHALCFGKGGKVAMWGDSFGHAWTPMALALGEKLKVPSVELSLDGCPPLIGADLTLRSPEEGIRCGQWNRSVARYLVANGADTLIVVARWENFLQPGDQSLARSIAIVSPHVRRILVIGPTPLLKDPPVKCAALGSDCAVPRAEYEARVAPALAAIRALRDPKVTMTDPANWFCGPELCPGIREGTALYSDQFHVSNAAAWEYAAIVAADWN